MKDQVQERLNALKTEYETGQKMLADLDARQANIRTTLVRISGAIQVLEELLAVHCNAGSPEHCAPLPEGRDTAE